MIKSIIIIIISILIFFLFLNFQNNLNIHKKNYLTTTNNNQVIYHKYYITCYSHLHEQAIWTSYITYPSLLKLTLYKRKNDFKEDQLVINKSVNDNYYNGSGYDRGHLVPAADMRFSQIALDETFYTSNISPQLPSFNRGIWSELEENIRNHIILSGDTAQIITGAVLNSKLNKIKGGISIPLYFYKIYFNYKKIVVFLLENKKYLKEDSPNNYTISVDSLEKITGLDFFYELPNNIENKLEKENNKLN